MNKLRRLTWTEPVAHRANKRNANKILEENLKQGVLVRGCEMDIKTRFESKVYDSEKLVLLPAASFRRVRKIAKSDYRLRHVCPSVRLSATWKISAPTGRIFMKFDI
jgi:hypothetical protein